MQTGNTTHNVSQVQRKKKARTHFKFLFREQANASKIRILGNSQRTNYMRVSSSHHYFSLLLYLIILSLCLLILFLYVPAHIHTLLWQKGVREEFGEEAGDLADRDGGAMGARPQGCLSTSLSTAERQLLGGQTLRVPKRPLPCRKGNDLIKLHSLLFHKQNHKCHFRGITLEQSASLNGNIATYTTVSYNSNPNNLLVNSRVSVQSQ